METQNVEMQNEKNITLGDIFILVKKFWLQVVCIVVAVTILATVYAMISAKPNYSAKATFAVNYKPENDTLTNQSQALSYSLKLINTVCDFIVDDVVVNDVKSVVKGQENSNIEYKYKGGLSIKTKEDSAVISIVYTTQTSGAAAVETVNQVIDSLKNVVNSVDENGVKKYETLYGSISEMSYATSYSVGETKSRIILIGFAGGVLLGCVYVFIRFLLDDTVKTKSDIERYTGFNVLAHIEDIDNTKKG